MEIVSASVFERAEHVLKSGPVRLDDLVKRVWPGTPDFDSKVFAINTGHMLVQEMNRAGYRVEYVEGAGWAILD